MNPERAPLPEDQAGDDINEAELHKNPYEKLDSMESGEKIDDETDELSEKTLHDITAEDQADSPDDDPGQDKTAA